MFPPSTRAEQLFPSALTLCPHVSPPAAPARYALRCLPGAKPANPPPPRAGEPDPNNDDDYDLDALTEIIHGDPAMVEQLEKLKLEEQKAAALVNDLAQKLQEAKNNAKEQKLAANQKARGEKGTGLPLLFVALWRLWYHFDERGACTRAMRSIILTRLAVNTCVPTAGQDARRAAAGGGA